MREGYENKLAQDKGVMAKASWNYNYQGEVDRISRDTAPQRDLSPADRAKQILAADAEHRSLAADQALMLRMTMPMLGVGLNTLADGISKWCKHQGFWPDGVSTDEGERLKKSEKIALMHSELSETLEAIRKGDRGNEREELADVAIRLLDYCGYYGIDLGHHIEAKMLQNYQRPYKHGKSF